MRSVRLMLVDGSMLAFGVRSLVVVVVVLVVAVSVVVVQPTSAIAHIAKTSEIIFFMPAFYQTVPDLSRPCPP